MNSINNINQSFNKGLQFFQNGKIDDAVYLFEKILKIEPNNLKANHALGVIYGKLLKHDKAKKYFEKALKNKPDFKPSLLNLAISLCELEEFSESENILNNLIQNDQSDPDLFIHLGNCLYKQDKLEQAELVFSKSINLNSSIPEPYIKIGFIKKKLKDYDQTISFFLKVLELDKNNINIIYQIGETLYLKESYSEAIAYFDQTIALSSDQNLIFNSKERMARSYDYIKDYDKSIALFKDILDSNLTDQIKERILSSLSNVYINKNDKDFDADYSWGQYYAQETLKINKNNLTALNNMGITSLYMQNLKLSLEYFEKAIAIDPTHTPSLKNIANAYDHIGLYEKNIETIEKYKKIKPNDKSLDTNLAMSLLSLGKFSEGWKFYEDRWNNKKADDTIKIMPNFGKPKWQPELGYGTILVWGEQGIGDQILHGTMLEGFSRRFKKAYLAIDPKLVRLFQDSFPNIEVYSLFDETSRDFFDYHIPLCSIGAYCRQSYHDFFPLKKYYQIKSSDEFKRNKKLKCALSWKSINGNKSDFKSTSLESLKKILELKNIDFYSIQYSEAEDEISQLKKNYGITVQTVDGLDPYNDVYGLMKFIQSCDFTISTSSSSAHLSGALNIPTYLLAAQAYGKFWYWDNIFDGKNVWYPSVKCFIQEEYKNWTHPIDNLFTFLTDTYDLGI